MVHLDDTSLAQWLKPEAVQQALEQAFLAFGAGQAAVQARQRIQVADVRVSTLSAAVPSLGVAGAKIYTTVKGRFSFVIVLFDAQTGCPLATLDAGAITRLRTAACSVLAARRYAYPESHTLALFGLGVQAWEHALQMGKAFPLQQILVHTREPEQEKLRALEQELGITVRAASAAEAISDANIIVTATRSEHALFYGRDVPKSCFVAAVGSSLPSHRELDDVLMQRARRVVIEWAEQTCAEAGDLLLANQNCEVNQKLVQLAEAMSLAPGQGYVPGEITVYKSVGMALQDIAVAGLAYRQYTSH